jgi:hypothetical protein
MKHNTGKSVNEKVVNIQLKKKITKVEQQQKLKKQFVMFVVFFMAIY